MSALRAGRFDEISAAADDAFRQDLPPEELERTWTAATETLGQLTGTGTAVVVHDLPLNFQNGDGHLQIAYRDGRIAGLVLRPGSPTGKFGE